MLKQNLMHIQFSIKDRVGYMLVFIFLSKAFIDATILALSICGAFISTTKADTMQNEYSAEQLQVRTVTVQNSYRSEQLQCRTVTGQNSYSYVMVGNNQFHKGIPNPGNRTEQKLSPITRPPVRVTVQTDRRSVKELPIPAANIFHEYLTALEQSTQYTVNSISEDKFIS